MIAAAKHMIERGYTTPDKLAAMGGSNGGLLMGALITQRPGPVPRGGRPTSASTTCCAWSSTPNGAFNVTEFGTVKDPAQFKALYAYSPYHNVKKAAYPAVLFTTGENDGRVDPYELAQDGGGACRRPRHRASRSCSASAPTPGTASARDWPRGSRNSRTSTRS